MDHQHKNEEPIVNELHAIYKEMKRYNDRQEDPTPLIVMIVLLVLGFVLLAYVEYYKKRRRATQAAVEISNV